jgi:hypothetical protein
MTGGQIAHMLSRSTPHPGATVTEPVGRATT